MWMGFIWEKNIKLGYRVNNLWVVFDFNCFILVVL